MGTQMMTITHQEAGADRRPRLSFSGSWLPEMGFCEDALVMAIPEPDGFAFTLQDEQITRYSDLVKQAKEKNGKLLQVIHATYKGRRFPAISTTGSHLTSSGLCIDDTVVVRYTPGAIRMRKLDTKGYGQSVTFAVVGSVKGKHPDHRIPKVRLTGSWLSAAGFEKDALVLASPQQGKITFTLVNEHIDRYSDLVKSARQSKQKLLQVIQIPSRGRAMPHIGLTGSVLSASGLAMDDLFVIKHKPGMFTLEKIDFHTLGF